MPEFLFSPYAHDRRERCPARRWLRLLTSLGLFCATLPLPGQNADDTLAQAASLIRQHQYDAAIAQLQHAVARNRTDPRLLTVEGIAYSLKGEDQHALACLQQALTLAPNFPRALQAEASILSRRRDPAVVPVLEELLRNNPQDTTAHEMLALARAQQGDCAKALPDFAAAGAAVAGHADSLQYKGACQLETHALPEAVATFTQVQQLRPADPGTAYDLAVAQLAAGDAKAALATLSPLLAGTPDVDTLLLGADASEQTGNTPQAAGLLRAAIVADPARSTSYVRFAELCMAHESYQPGVDMVTAGLARLPHDPSLFLARGLLYGGMAQYDKAEADFRQAEQFDPHHGTGAYAVGLIEAQRNNPTQALTTVRSALQQHPGDAQLHFLLARLLLEKGAQPDSATYAEAAKAAEDAVRLQPDLVSARDLLAKVYIETGKPAQAVAQCRAALALDPADGNALYRLMRALRATGDTEGAQAVAREVAAQHQHAREEETGRLRYRIEEGSGSPARTPSASAPDQQPAAATHP